MTFAQNVRLLPAILLLCWAACAHAETIEERCEAATNDHSAYSRCVAAETSKVTSTLSRAGKDVVCTGTTCIHRLEYDKAANKYVGKELSVEVKPAETGREWVIVDLKKRTTTYFQCGTCRSIEYDSGPLDDVSIRSDTESALMVTVRTRQR